ncbi:unnamed protein product [Protopolystoma xenopodis]|uniref:Uncharacterized protein n=1 Tax=Protopolystoma xenopodis TaxID=117903 RepID=A0A3S5AX68_9PLAT|nr:unnamed protein product [Protopolystoma xenopodis]
MFFPFDARIFPAPSNSRSAKSIYSASLKLSSSSSSTSKSPLPPQIPNPEPNCNRQLASSSHLQEQRVANLRQLRLRALLGGNAEEAVGSKETFLELLGQTVPEEANLVKPDELDLVTNLGKRPEALEPITDK